MEWFDVLLSHNWTGAGERSWYFVYTVKAASESAAVAKAKAKSRVWFKKANRELLWSTFHGVGSCGSYPEFTGKYVGQFIDEAACR